MRKEKNYYEKNVRNIKKICLLNIYHDKIKSQNHFQTFFKLSSIYKQKKRVLYVSESIENNSNPVWRKFDIQQSCVLQKINTPFFFIDFYLQVDNDKILIHSSIFKLDDNYLVNKKQSVQLLQYFKPVTIVSTRNQNFLFFLGQEESNELKYLRLSMIHPITTKKVLSFETNSMDKLIQLSNKIILLKISLIEKQGSFQKSLVSKTNELSDEDTDQTPKISLLNSQSLKSLVISLKLTPMICRIEKEIVQDITTMHKNEKIKNEINSSISKYKNLIDEINLKLSKLTEENDKKKKTIQKINKTIINKQRKMTNYLLHIYFFTQTTRNKMHHKTCCNLPIPNVAKDGEIFLISFDTKNIKIGKIGEVKSPLLINAYFGNICLFLCILSKIFFIPLVYPINIAGSNSTILNMITNNNIALNSSSHLEALSMGYKFLMKNVEQLYKYFDLKFKSNIYDPFHHINILINHISERHLPSKEQEINIFSITESITEINEELVEGNINTETLKEEFIEKKAILRLSAEELYKYIKCS